ncbi:hypothetical protein BCR42DRAFT_429837 [Absidia repens]|uniref:Uncharacterized protein n=1 Tax=Absidia repens TaxID=90262 RepID=A0A1X2HR25_9FUNG|nr:hypothetical protein BCR42DRAFT_429837 [Absidia repens]
MYPNFGYHEQQQYQHDPEQNTLMNDALEAEELYFADYDHAMQLEADYFEQQHDHALNEEYNDDMAHQEDLPSNDGDDDTRQLQQYQQYEDDEMMDMDTAAAAEEYDYQEDTLLKLIVDVQLYISDLANVGVDRHDSPLVGLQYKMYTYLKQRANDMGVDASALM